MEETWKDSIKEIMTIDQYTMIKYWKCGREEWNIAYQYNPETREWASGNYAYSWAEALATMLSKVDNSRLKSSCEKEANIAYERMSEIASKAIDGLFEDDEESAIEFIKNELEMDKEEAKYFGINDKLFPKKWRIVELDLIRTQKAKIQIVMPDDEPDFNAIDYAENLENIDDCMIDSDDWEDDGVSREVASDLTTKQILNHYDQGDIWNYEDVYEED